MAKSRLAKAINLDQRSVSFTTEADDHYNVMLDDMPADIITRLALHGLSQKLGDCFAGQSLAEGIARFETTLDNLKRGQWASTQHGILAQAISNLTDRPLSEVRKRLDEMDKTQRTKLRKDTQVAAEILRIEQERLGDTEEDGGLLADLFETEGEE